MYNICVLLKKFRVSVGLFWWKALLNKNLLLLRQHSR